MSEAERMGSVPGGGGESSWRREQFKDGGVGGRVRLGPGLEQTGFSEGRGSGEGCSFRPGGRPRSEGMLRVLLMLDRTGTIFRSAQ